MDISFDYYKIFYEIVKLFLNFHLYKNLLHELKFIDKSAHIY